MICTFHGGHHVHILDTYNLVILHRSRLNLPLLASKPWIVVSVTGWVSCARRPYTHSPGFNAISAVMGIDSFVSHRHLISYLQRRISVYMPKFQSDRKLRFLSQECLARLGCRCFVSQQSPRKVSKIRLRGDGMERSNPMRCSRSIRALQSITWY